MISFPSGVHQVAVSPFRDDKKKSFDGEAWVEYLITVVMGSGVDGLVLLGTTTEAPCFTTEEKIEMVKITRETLGNSLFLTVGVGGSSTLEATKLALATREYCDAFMVTVPPYNKPSQEGMIKHFVAVAGYHEEYTYLDGYAELRKKPMMCYNIPSRTGSNMLPESILHVATHCPNFCAVKEASGNIVQVTELCRLTRKLENFKVFSGDDLALLPTMSVGGAGVVSVLANVLPREMSQLYRLCERCDYHGAQHLNDILQPITKALFCETNPGPVKRLMVMRNFFSKDVFRLPMLPVKESTDRYLQQILEETNEDLREYWASDISWHQKNLKQKSIIVEAKKPLSANV